MDFTGKVCIVTGAGGGIGSAIANEFYKLGANIAIMAPTWSWTAAS